MTLIKFEPFREFDHLTSQIEKFFDSGNSAFAENKIVPSIDIYELKDSLIVEVEAPGIKKENLRLTLEDNILTIEGEKKSLEQNDVVRIFRSERSFGKFKRSFTLPVDVDPDKVNAKFENGVLTITLQKLEEKNVNEKTIELK
jgi:HSP20 family protein